MISIIKYKQNRDDVTCSINIETEIDDHSDVKQAVKWQVFRHVTEDLSSFSAPIRFTYHVWISVCAPVSFSVSCLCVL